MNVLVTGGLGHLGRRTVAELVRQGHRVRILARPGRVARKRARRLAPEIEIVWGDIRRVADVERAVAGQAAIVHLAAVLPPQSETDATEAEGVNVGGTRTLVDVVCRQARPARLLFTSSFDVFGPSAHRPPPRRVTDAPEAANQYARQKLAAEAIVQASGLRWLIFRCADIPWIALRKPIPFMFELPADNRIEVIHPADAGLAIANALGCEPAWGRVLLIGGGRRCQVYYRDYVGKVLAAMGIGPLPDAAFTTVPFGADWLDTEESERLLRYQRSSLDDIVNEIARLAWWPRGVSRLARPFVRSWILALSPYWRARAAAPRSQ